MQSHHFIFRLNRANQIYSFPIHLSEEMMPSAVFYGTVVPLIVYILVKKVVVEPFVKDQQALKTEKQKQINKKKLVEKRKEAMAAVELMAATYSRIFDEEETKRGLIIVKALYGKVLTGKMNNN